MSTIVENLTKNIVSRDLQKEGAALMNKWERTGLLEGLGNERTKNNMARLLENQAKELLREASTMSAGDVEGFAAVAFPIVRRVFGGLIANELVSVQPMSLPSGLIFFLDFTFESAKAAGGAVKDESVYGGGKVGRQVTGGVNLEGAENQKSFYGLNNGYSSATGSNSTVTTAGDLGGRSSFTFESNLVSGSNSLANGQTLGSDLSDQTSLRIIDYDPDVMNDSANYYVAIKGDMSTFTNINKNDLVSLDVSLITDGTSDRTSKVTTVRRLTKLDPANITGSTNDVVIVLKAAAEYGGSDSSLANNMDRQVQIAAGSGSWVVEDISNNSSIANGALDLDLFGEGAGGDGSFTSTGLSGQNDKIAEIDIKVDSVAVTATTKKLKAKWSPELAQDLNAYHNLDAEVELTSILSEQVALEIDQEILQDLVKGATGAVLYWSRKPGKFVNRETGADQSSATAPPDFTGNVSEWYETLAETINDVSARIHRKTLRGGANFVVCSPEVANLLEFTAGFRATVNHEELKGGQIGAVKVGAMSKKFDVYVDPYFPRSVILIGRRGNSFLETGYVYAPYVPLQVTPTIFGVEDFVPRKGVLTRYAKKMVRPDMYGIVVCQDLV
jgi:hypothetical protein|tara:strand:- start:10397 stop:12238 length:1842 start_codon:yes stop_codon:yes gene_type:complete